MQMNVLPLLAEVQARARLEAGNTPTIDLFQTADDIVTLLWSRAVADAMTFLDRARRGRPQVVQDALDRLVSARQPMCHAPPAGAPPAVAFGLRRVAFAYGTVPRMPNAAQMAALNQQQRHDVYASIVELRGTRAATAAARAGHRVILGLRASGSSFVNNGKGVYNDSIVVLHAQRQVRTVAEFLRATTESTAQYDQNQRGRRGITPREAEGNDVTGDGILDAGQMGTGTYEMFAATHPNPRGGEDWALRPTPGAVRTGAGMIQRDTNHDGLFNSDDPNGRHSLNPTFKIHAGSRNNTDSAGCQTIHRDDYDSFVRATRVNGQSAWQYVLVETAP